MAAELKNNVSKLMGLTPYSVMLEPRTLPYARNAQHNTISSVYEHDVVLSSN